MKEKGFTLIELLAVIVILAIVLAIAVPSITKIVNKTKRNAFESDAKMVIKAIDYKVLQVSGYELDKLDVEKVGSDLKLNNKNYNSFTALLKNKEIFVLIEGTGKWAGLTAYGTLKKMKVVNTEDIIFDSPVITLIGDAVITVSLNSTYEELGALAYGEFDGDITADIVIDNSDVNTEVEGSYSVTYNVQGFFYAADEVVRTVNVREPKNFVMNNNGDTAIIPINEDVLVGDTFTFNYTNNDNLNWTPVVNGEYNIKAFGAGGNSISKGAIVGGNINLNKTDSLNFKIHSKGNGGGAGGIGGKAPGYDSRGKSGDAGGGGTLVKLNSVLILAAGGGGGKGADGVSSYYETAGCGGAGGNGNCYGNAGTSGTSGYAGGAGGDIGCGGKRGGGQYGAEAPKDGKDGPSIYDGGGGGGACLQTGSTHCTAGAGGGGGGQNYVDNSIVNSIPNEEVCATNAHGQVIIELISIIID